MQKVITLIVASILLTNCARHPNSIQPSYVNPALYQNQTCYQLASIRADNKRQLEKVSQKQDIQHTTDVASGIVGVFFWPMWLFVLGGSKEKEVADLKGQDKALLDALAMKGCKGG